jgi:CRISPR-associated protein Csd2
MTAHLNPSTRHDFRLVFEVVDGNPNGDPDNGNQPRVDFETQQALVSDVSLKRKLRDHVAELVAAGALPADRYDIYIERGAELNLKNTFALEQHPDQKGAGAADKRATGQQRAKAMCDRFFDVRMFGAMMRTDNDAGIVRGPVQFNVVARSVDPVQVQSLAITRVARTEKTYPKDHNWETSVIHSDGTMGDKHFIRYALFVIDGYFTARQAQVTGVDERDMETLWHALTMMFENDRSAARGRLATRGLYVFSHSNPLGNAPAHTLLERVSVKRVTQGSAVSSFEDYTVDVGESELPAGVTLTRIVG